MSQPEHPQDHRREGSDSAESPPTPTPLQQSESESTNPHDAEEIVRRNLARYDHRQRCFKLNAERLKIFSECLATPIRPPRDDWFAAWRQIADGTASDDLDAVVVGIEAAVEAFAAMNSVVTHWFRRAREWLDRARPTHSGFNALVGFDTLESFAEWDSKDLEYLPAMLAAKQEVFDWALTIEQLRSLRAIYPQMSGYSCSVYTVPNHCLDLLALIIAGATTQQVRTFFGTTRGPNWLAGLAGVMAVVVGPLLPSDVFRPNDLPANECERGYARYLTNLTVYAFGHFNQCTQFAQRYFPLPTSAPTEIAQQGEAGGEGSDVSNSGTIEPVPPPPDAVKPVWNPEERVLTFGSWRLEYGKSAPSQEKILAAFQAAGWPSAVRKSLPANLCGILQNMRNKLGTEFPISFDADGAGGVRWQPK